MDLQRALRFYREGDLVSAEEVCKRVLKQAPANAEALHLLGLIAYAAGHYAHARDLITRAISLRPNSADCHLNLGNALVQLGEREAALACFDRAAALQPDLAEVYFYRGNLFQDMKRFERAVADYGRAIALNPTLPESYFNRGSALVALDRREEALESYLRCSELLPEHLESRKNVFWLRLSGGADDALVEALSREIGEIEARAEARRLFGTKSIPAFRAAHDLEQIAYLRAHTCDVDGLAPAYRSLKAVMARLESSEADTGDIALSEDEIADIVRFRGAHVRYPTSASFGLNPNNDWAALEERYFGEEILVIDDFLSADALAQLQQFCLVSTVWRQEYKNGYLGAFAHGGFVGPLHLQIARDLSAALPRLFGGQNLEQLWAFKYDQQSARGINVHADFATLNLNFWITPDTANLDPESGGMVIYDKPPPDTWNAREYNNVEDQQRIYAFLKDVVARTCVVPYRCNRAVLFNSKLFHETDRIHFKPGYENRRINVTYLFGRGTS